MITFDLSIFKGEHYMDHVLAKVTEASMRLGIGDRLYAYGGYVRDRILGREPSDIDMHLTSENKDENEDAAAKIASFMGLALAPRVNGSGPKFRVDSVEFDFSHRTRPDLRALALSTEITINALQLRLSDMCIVDAFGISMKDLNERIVRLSASTIKDWDASPHRAVILLRVPIMASRFGFAIEPETLAFVRQHAWRIATIPDDLARWNMSKAGPGIQKRLLECRMLQFIR